MLSPLAQELLRDLGKGRPRPAPRTDAKPAPAASPQPEQPAPSPQARQDDPHRTPEPKRAPQATVAEAVAPQPAPPVAPAVHRRAPQAPPAPQSARASGEPETAILDAFVAQTPQQRLNPFAGRPAAGARIPEPKIDDATQSEPAKPAPVRRPGVIAVEHREGGSPRLALRVGRKFVWSLGLGLFSHMASGVLAGAAAGGAAYLISTSLAPALSQIIAFSAFLGVMTLWIPSAMGLATRYAWRSALNEEGAPNAVAMALAGTLVPAGDDDQKGLDASGLGLYRLRERVRDALDEALSGSLRARWLRRTVTYLTSSGVDKATKRRLGTVEDMSKLDRGAVRRAITHAIESALVGAG